MKYVNQAVPKMDAKALVTGKGVYVNDLAPSDCLIVKVVRSPYAHALIKSIDKSKAMFGCRELKAVFTCEDCPDKRFTWQDRLIRSQVRMTD